MNTTFAKAPTQNALELVKHWNTQRALVGLGMASACGMAALIVLGLFAWNVSVWDILAGGVIGLAFVATVRTIKSKMAAFECALDAELGQISEETYTHKLKHSPSWTRDEIKRGVNFVEHSGKLERLMSRLN